MPALLCPSCGAEVPLRSAAMPYAVCAYCQSVLLRDGDAAKAIGKSAVLPFDVSPIQIGTTIDAGGVTFEVVGRVRWGWDAGSWNEWLMRGGDGSTRWLGEAMGMFMLLAESPAALDQPLAQGFAKGEAITPYATIDVDGTQFVASDIKEAKCLGGEGDLPFPAATDWTMTSVDFRTTDGSAFNLQRDSQGTSAWIGRYAELIDLKPRKLRAIDGWTIPAGMR